MPSRWRSRAGVGRLGCLVGLLVLALFMYIAVPLVQAEMRYRKAQDRLRDRARTINVERSFEVEDRLRPVIRQLELPRQAERMDVRVAPGATRRFSVIIQYADTLEVKPWSWVIERRIEVITS